MCATAWQRMNDAGEDIEMGNLIFIIVFIIIIVNKAKRANHKAEGDRTLNKPVNARTTVDVPKRKREKQARGVAKTAAAAKNKATAEKIEMSTTEYLHQKAMEDMREHHEEKRQEALRLQRETGGRQVGVRYLYGDSIPHGMRLVKCHYCAAENLITGHRKQSDYTCYFCREIL